MIIIDNNTGKFHFISEFDGALGHEPEIIFGTVSCTWTDSGG